MRCILFVERKNDVNTNYYNLIGTERRGARRGVDQRDRSVPRVLSTKARPNPYSGQTKPGVLLAGGKNVVYKYSESGDGTQAHRALGRRLRLEHAHRRHDDVRQFHSRRSHRAGQEPISRTRPATTAPARASSTPSSTPRSRRPIRPASSAPR